MKSRKRQSWKSITVQHDCSNLQQSSESTVCGGDVTAEAHDAETKGLSGRGHRRLPGVSSQWVAFRDKLPVAKLARTPSSASLNNRFSKETGLMVPAEQQSLRRTAVALHVRVWARWSRRR